MIAYQGFCSEVTAGTSEMVQPYGGEDLDSPEPLLLESESQRQDARDRRFSTTEHSLVPGENAVEELVS